MKVLQVLAGGTHGGAEMAFVDMCQAMKDKGVDVSVITRPNKIRVPILRDCGLKTYTLPFGSMVDIYTPLAIQRIIRAEKPDIVQTWMSRASQKTPNWNQTKIDKRYINIARLGGYYKTNHFKNSDYFIAITPDIKTYLVNEGVSSQRVRYINNFAETEKDSDPVNRESLDTPSDASILLTLARLHESKALDVIIDALPDLPNTYLWIAGEGPLRKQLEDQVENLGLKNRVRFLGWRTDRSALLQAADICLFTSRYEPFGTVFAQSWANKTPVIVSNTEGPKQFCRHGEDCLMISKDSRSDLIKAIQTLQSDTVLLMNLVQNGYQRYLNEFTKEKAVQSYLDFYQDILQS